MELAVMEALEAVGRVRMVLEEMVDQLQPPQGPVSPVS
jgi:hypothetical protein